MDDLKRRSAAAVSKTELDKLQGDKKDKEGDRDSTDGTRITRLKAQQMATGIGTSQGGNGLGILFVYSTLSSLKGDTGVWDHHAVYVGGGVLRFYTYLLPHRQGCNI
jgi:hypothetical protein